MTAFELMERMTVEELLYWGEFDRIHIDRNAYQFAAIMAKLDWIKGVKRPDARRYLPKVKKRRRARTAAQIRAHFLWAAAASGGLKAKATEGSDGKR